ncbi:hypothetical protein Drose_01640 [Dactylosporangium roseum]|uniref:Uncharacterized protein n=1 Tax=Dactylosporangium roseum TaxID=47989 RepID=A0ABY5Z5W5_9ACTN|nr:hypothetical protein [Dactylosporangium roseum]UWZ37054.1 hypothetical protein Drose_01640 [Dactylosporangium roseum]
MLNVQTVINDAIGVVKDALSTAFRWIGGKIDEAVGWFNGLRNRFDFGDLFGGIRTAFKSALNWIIGKWNGLQFATPSVEFMGVRTDARTIRVPHIEPFARGGVVQPRPGGLVGRIAEAGQAEAVAPIETLKEYVVDAVTTAIGQNGGNAPIIVEAHIYLDGRELKQTVVETIAASPDTVAKANRAGAKKLNYAG